MKKADTLRALALLTLIAAAVAGLIVLSVNAPLREALGESLGRFRGSLWGPVVFAAVYAVACLVIPFTLLNYAFGLTKVRFRDYVLASWIGMLPGTVMYVYLGSTVKELAGVAAGNVEGGPARRVLFFVGLAATVIVTVYVTRLARQALRQAVPDAETEGVPHA